MEYIRPAPHSGCRYSKSAADFEVRATKRKHPNSDIAATCISLPGYEGKKNEIRLMERPGMLAKDVYIGVTSSRPWFSLYFVRSMLIEGKGEIAEFGSHCARKPGQVVISA